MVEKECACYGCAECIHCGRNRQYYNVVYCDECGKEGKYRCNDQDYCLQCLLLLYDNIWYNKSLSEKIAMLIDFDSDYEKGLRLDAVDEIWDACDIEDKSMLLEMEYEEL